MKKIVIFTLLVLTLALFSACNLFQSSVVEPEEKQVENIVVEKTGFSGENIEVNVAKSLISFKGGKNGVLSHEGNFTDFDVTFGVDEGDSADLTKASVIVTVDLNSMLTDNDRLTGHLLSDDFFAAETYPDAVFQSIDITSLAEENMYAVTGDLTMKGITETVTFEMEITDEYVFSEYDLDRSLFSIGEEGDVDNMIPMVFKFILQ